MNSKLNKIAVHCPNCGSEMQQSRSECPNCGFVLDNRSGGPGQPQGATQATRSGHSGSGLRSRLTRLSRAEKLSVGGGSLLLLAVVLPWLNWPGGSANLLTGGEMEIYYQVGFNTESTTVGNSTALLLALLGAAAGIGLPLYRRWDGISMAAVTGVGLLGVILFQIPAIMATGNDVTAVVVDGETVAGTVSTGLGVYAAIAGSALLIFAGGAGLLGALRSRIGS